MAAAINSRAVQVNEIAPRSNARKSTTTTMKAMVTDDADQAHTSTAPNSATEATTTRRSKPSTR